MRDCHSGKVNDVRGDGTKAEDSKMYMGCTG